MGHVIVRIDDADVASVALYAPLPWPLRLDVLPFAFLYSTAIYLFLIRPENDIVPTLLAAITVFAHALTFLIGEWSVDAGAWLGYAPLRQLRVADARAVVVVKVVPAKTMLPKQLCPCVVIHDRAIDPAERSDVPLLFFSYQNLTFCLKDDLKAMNAGLASFRRLDFPTQLPLKAYTVAKGYASAQEVARAQLKWGKNDFDIPVPRFAALLKEQLVAPFFVFQFFCMLLWCLDEYVYYSLMTLCMLVIFECTVVKQRQRNMETLNGMRRPPQPLFVYRANRWSELMSDQLVPGDICSIGQKVPGVVAQSNEDKVTNVPCDLLLLRGNCIVNESMLTGESVPLRKEAIDSLSDSLSIDDGTNQAHKKHVLFGGTKILQHSLTGTGTSSVQVKIPNAPDKGCLVYVLRTGFATTQGSLMRTILHSSQRVTANTNEAMWFILLLLGFAIAAAGFVLHHGLNDPTRNRFKLLLHCIMIVTSVVPPELPMELSLAVTNSLLALMRFNIYCTEPFRIPFAGRVDVCCFDKTGTLTSDELIMRGVAGLEMKIDDSSHQHDGHYDMIAPDHLMLDTELVLAGCQSLVFLNGHVVGDPLETTALKNIKWTLSFGSSQHGASTVEPTFFSSNRGVIQAVHILHRFSFSSDLKRMTTIVSVVKTDNDEEDELRVLTKGAPEVLESLFAHKPAHYSRVYRYFASKGCRVLALGYRRLSNVTAKSIDEFVCRSTRSDIENDLVFAGFLVLDCPLKEDTKRTIRDLIVSKHKIIVITGDNALTACDAARQIGVNVNDSEKSLISQTTASGEIEWRGIDDGSVQENDLVRYPFSAKSTKELSIGRDLCITGEALTALAVGLEEQHEKDEALAFEEYLQALVMVCPFVNVFARTSPQQKEHIIMALNRAGKTTAMCGDGTNDVGALKRSHVGVSIVNNPDAENSHRSLAASLALEKNHSLHERLRQIQDEEQSGMVRLGDASIASPFTSKSSSIRVVKQLVRQGRCTLVTTIQVYKILGVNCLITAYYLSSLYLHGVKNGDQQLTIVGLAIAMFFLFLSRARPAKRVSSERPPSGVFNGPVLFSILGQSFIHLTFLVAALTIAQPFIDYADPSMHPDGKFSPNVVNTIMFLLSAIMQLNTFVANYKGKPFMESFSQNKLLSRSAMASYGALTLAVFELLPSLNEMLELEPMPNDEVQFAVFGLMVGDTIAVQLLERAIDYVCAGWY